MRNKIKEISRVAFQNWREVAGWIVIGIFMYVYLFRFNTSHLLAGRTFAPYFLVIAVIFILSWLNINNKK